MGDTTLNDLEKARKAQEAMDAEKAKKKAEKKAEKKMKKAKKLAKRYADTHKASVTRAAHHIGLAKSAHAKGMDRLRKAAACLTEAHKLGKAADSEEMAQHMAAAHDHFNTASAEMDDTEALLGRAMSAWGHSTNVSDATDPGGAVNVPSLSDLTEGDVPWYDSAVPYGSKAAKVIEKMQKKFDKKLKKLSGKVQKGAITPEQAEEMVKAAAEKARNEAKIEMLQSQVESLSKLPAGSPKVKVFDFDHGQGQGSEAANKAALLTEGVDMNIQNESDFTKAAGSVIANMIKNGPKFGKNSFGKPPMWDPSFHGRGGTGARN